MSMLNPIQGMGNIAAHIRSRAHSTVVAAKVDARQWLGVETKYVDVTIKVGWQYLLDLVLDLKRWPSSESSVRPISPRWR